MPFDMWLTFVPATVVVLMIPGPTVMLVVGHALGRGRASGWATVPGVALGDLTAMTVSMAGAGAILAASATLFTVLKLIGAAYLIWLGIRLWRSGATMEPAAPVAGGAMFWNAYVVTALNPKSIMFFIAFVPQFMTPAMSMLWQVAILEATFVVLAATNAAVWAVAAGTMRAGLRGRKARAINRVGGGFLIGAGVLSAVAGRTS